MIQQLQPHDLLRIEVSRFLVPEDASSWAAIESCLRHAPFVVVRRARMKDGYVPVGIRGQDRGERYAAWLDPRGVRAVLKPESLRTSGQARDLRALAALRECEQRFRSLHHPWGPTGSTGFELASGIATVTETSDLDLLIHMMERPTDRELAAIANACNDLPCAVDLQIATPHGAFSLREYCSGSDRLLLRTCTGPVLVIDPWKPVNLCNIPA
jgi:phosphoribosyl-dephospho-CoA transferase